MEKVKRNYWIPVELDEWLEGQGSSKTDLVVFALQLVSEMDIEFCRKVSKEQGLLPGQAVNMALFHLRNLSEADRHDLTAKFYAFLAERSLERSKQD